MRHKKKISILLIVLVLLSFSGCKKEESKYTDISLNYNYTEETANKKQEENSEKTDIVSSTDNVFYHSKIKELSNILRSIPANSEIYSNIYYYQDEADYSIYRVKDNICIFSKIGSNICMIQGDLRDKLLPHNFYLYGNNHKISQSFTIDHTKIENVDEYITRVNKYVYDKEGKVTKVEWQEPNGEEMYDEFYYNNNGDIQSALTFNKAEEALGKGIFTKETYALNDITGKIYITKASTHENYQLVDEINYYAETSLPETKNAAVLAICNFDLTTFPEVIQRF